MMPHLLRCRSGLVESSSCPHPLGTARRRSGLMCQLPDHLPTIPACRLNQPALCTSSIYHVTDTVPAVKKKAWHCPVRFWQRGRTAGGPPPRREQVFEVIPPHL